MLEVGVFPHIPPEQGLDLVSEMLAVKLALICEI